MMPKTNTIIPMTAYIRPFSIMTERTKNMTAKKMKFTGSSRSLKFTLHLIWPPENGHHEVCYPDLVEDV